MVTHPVPAVFISVAEDIVSASINGILQCGLGGQKLYIEEKETF